MKQLHRGLSDYLPWLAMVMIFSLLTACHHRQVVIERSGLPTKVAGTNDPAMIAMQAHFRDQGIRVITEGQDYMISIPSVKLFPNESPQLTWDSFSLLNDVACFLKQFRKISITVTAFSNKCVSAKRDHALTLARARAVGDYLWSQGVDSRFIFTQGLGSDKPIIGFVEGGDKSHNSRIEITFRDEVA